MSQLVKNPLAMRETWVLSLGWEDPLERGTATHSSILAWRIPVYSAKQQILCTSIMYIKSISNIAESSHLQYEEDNAYP